MKIILFLLLLSLCLVSCSKSQPKEFPTLESLMPKFEVRTNAPTSFQIAVLAHNTNVWTIIPNIFTDPAEAVAVIEESKQQLRLKYEVAKEIHDAIARMPEPKPAPKAKVTYTVETPVWKTSNAVEVIQNHEPGCHLVRYMVPGFTNAFEFHAWAVPVIITTNK
jgi:hypothetical protein